MISASLNSSALSCLQSLEDGVLGTKMTDLIFRAGPLLDFLLPIFFVNFLVLVPLNQDDFSKIFFL